MQLLSAFALFPHRHAQLFNTRGTQLLSLSYRFPYEPGVTSSPCLARSSFQRTEPDTDTCYDTQFWLVSTTGERRKSIFRTRSGSIESGLDWRAPDR